MLAAAPAAQTFVLALSHTDLDCELVLEPPRARAARRPRPGKAKRSAYSTLP